MPLDWKEVVNKYGSGATIPTVAGGKTLKISAADDEAIQISHSLWKDSLERVHLERAVELIESGTIPRDARWFVEDYRALVADVRATSVAHILKDLGHLQ